MKNTQNYVRAEKLLEKCTSCCLATIDFLCERGLLLQESNEIINSGNNGNYLISQFDPFLSQHIRQFANRGRGHLSYLLKTICDGVVTIMDRKCLVSLNKRL